MQLKFEGFQLFFEIHDCRIPRTGDPQAIMAKEVEEQVGYLGV